MTSRERVLAALERRQPDRVPYVELSVDRPLARQLLGWNQEVPPAVDLEHNSYTHEEMLALADHLGLDALFYVMRAPVYAEHIAGKDGRMFYGDGLIRTESDLTMMDLPDPTNPRLYDEARAFAAAKGERAAAFITRAGIFPTLLSMGMEGFSIALYENRPFLETILDRYFDWAIEVAERVCRLGFDLYVTTDDMAHKTGPLFSPAVFHELVMPRYRRLAEKVNIPWVMHSDGNIEPLLADLLSLGIAGIHPLEKGAVDIRQIKARYGQRLCLLGNVDLNILGNGTVEETEAEVRGLIGDLGPGGGYIISSGNSLASYLKPANVNAMARVIRSQA
jgi:uroporphyrinogen decarboxylase